MEWGSAVNQAFFIFCISDDLTSGALLTLEGNALPGLAIS